MCLILLSYNQYSGYRLILAANRDEFLDRPTAPLGYHYHGETILAGRDLRGGGTWLGVNDRGDLAAITNYRDPQRIFSTAPSRGEIVLDYLRSGLDAPEFLADFSCRAAEYNGLNLLLSDRNGLYYFSNVTMRAEKLAPGCYGLSNHLLNSDWPKVQLGKKLFDEGLSEGVPPERDSIFELLANSETPPDDRLPETGVGLEWERLLGPMFIHSPNYGTRSSSLVIIRDDGAAEFSERTYEHGEGWKKTGEKIFSVPAP